MKKTLNLAFLGCGFATRLHSKTLSGFKNIRRFYASRDKGKAEAYNRKYKGQGAFGSYESVVNANEVDVVLVATPPSQHLDLTLQALEAGKHVIVEKPPFLNSNDFDTIRQAQETSGRRVFIAENYFYKPLAIKLREIMASGAIGEILFVHVNALKKQVIEANDWRDDSNLAGGGALFEGGIHWINFIANLGLKIKSVHGFQPGTKKKMEQSILVALEYEEGAVGTFYYSWETPSLFKGLRISKIYGKEGSVTFETNGIFVIVRGKKKRLIFPGLKDIAGYKAMFADFIECVQNDRDPRFSLDLAKQDLKLIEEIYRSARKANGSLAET
ncbi:Gfo/Idh/MocA family oxidoreductase [candidate division KSB1 bacterium]|nr:Gfo/Idh/MocA family oxidoreductase [candidate division KSB1 bacterium]NIX69185.1 Gfo/Idh/MocA family oxidoreductase [candidate division KSB1 bacterium]